MTLAQGYGFKSHKQIAAMRTAVAIAAQRMAAAQSSNVVGAGCHSLNRIEHLRRLNSFHECQVRVGPRREVPEDRGQSVIADGRECENDR